MTAEPWWDRWRPPMLPESELARMTRELVGEGGLNVCGIGVDCETIDAVARAHSAGGIRRFRRLFTPLEQDNIGDDIARQAGRFVAKEAVVKTLGLGFREGLAARHIEIVTDESGAPEVRLHGPARDAAKNCGVVGCFVSWSRTDSHVVAVAIAAGKRPGFDEPYEPEERS